MIEPTLQIPVIINPVAASSSSALPIRPDHVASWTSSTPSGPSRHIALSDASNSIWIHTSPLDNLPSPNAIPPPPSQPLPKIKAPREITSPRRPTPYRTQSAGHRSRADSIASSILTSASSSRRVSAFSPPPSARIPTAVLSSATATVSASDGHTRQSTSDRNELRDHLREQRDRDPNETVGLGIAFGRRSLQVHSKEEIDSSGNTSPTGPGTLSRTRSTTSFDSSRTVGGMRGWLRGDDDTKEREKEIAEKMEEVEVEREMMKEVEEEKRELEEQAAVEKCEVSTPKGTVDGSEKCGQDKESGVMIRRIVLDQPGRGNIVQLKVFQELGLLVVLRDIGILELIGLDAQKVISSVRLEQPEPKLGEAGSSKTPIRLSPFWSWKKVHFAKGLQGSAILIAEGVPWPCAMPSPNGEVTRVVMLSADPSGIWDVSTGLELPGTGPIGICRQGPAHHLLHFLPDSLTSYSIRFPAHPIRPQQSSTTSSAAASPKLLRPSTPSPENERLLKKTPSNESLRDYPAKDKETKFGKFLAARRSHPSSKDNASEERKAGIGEGTEVERDGYGHWDNVSVSLDGSGYGFSGNCVDLFSCDGQKLRLRGTVTLDEPILDVLTTAEPGLVVKTPNAVHLCRAQHDQTRWTYDVRRKLPPARLITGSPSNALITVGDSAVVLIDTRQGGDGKGIVGLETPNTFSSPAILLPYNGEDCFTADRAGNVHKQRLSDVLAGNSPENSEIGNDRLDSAVTVAKVISGDRLVGGDEDGAIRIWGAKSFESYGSITVFADPVSDITLITAKGNDLDGHLLCTSRDGTVALISLDDLDLLYLIPASRAPLRRVFIDGKDILLTYSNGKARVWNHQTCEFRRSTGLDAAEDMLTSGDWTEIPFDEDQSLIRQPVFSLPSVYATGSDLARQVIVDIRAVGNWVQAVRAGSSPLQALRALLSLLLSFGVDADTDTMCHDQLGIAKPSIPVQRGKQSSTSTIYNCSETSEAAETVCLRQLAIIAMLRPFLDAPDSEKSAVKVMAYYAGQISENQPDLSFFARYYMDSSSDVHQAARILFKARLERMTDEEIEGVVSAAQTEFASAPARSLVVIGGIALHRYQSVNPTALKSAADAIFRYLSKPTSPHLALAIELASKGFATWQTYLDPMDLLRLLFKLATHNPPTTQLSAQARLAVLHIANLYPGLFMSTLSMDILDAETIERRTSIMKLCVFMARKKPGVIQAGLPRIAESVVRSLDPNIGKMREDVQETATVILNELVLAFSTIDFHSGTQRLAVGTHEGAVIMYDLKTASRLYVLEPHHAPVSSVNFSPDGRRLVTVSLVGGDVTVWKVGSSLSGFFNVGGPPRQGGNKGEPFKRIEFMRVDSGPLAETSALSDIRVEWPGLRQAKVQIKETALTFET